MVWVYGGVSILLTAIAVVFLLRMSRSESAVIYDPQTGNFRRVPPDQVPKHLVRREIDGVPEAVWVDPGKLPRS